LKNYTRKNDIGFYVFIIGLRFGRTEGVEGEVETS